MGKRIRKLKVVEVERKQTNIRRKVEEVKNA